MAYNISAFAGAGAQFFDSNGVPLAGGLLYVYTAGTTTPATTWTTNSGAVANTNPIVLNAAGRTPYEIWLNNGATYKFALYTSTNVLIGTYDNIPAIDDPTAFNNLITVTGTNTLVGSATPPYTAYVAGMTLSFIPVNTNTGAVTLDVDGLGAKNIYAGSSTPLIGSELVAGRIVQIEYDGVRFQLYQSSVSIPDGAVTTAKLADGAVTTAKLADGAATGAKLGSDVIKTTGTQTVGGAKTFTSPITFNDTTQQNTAFVGSRAQLFSANGTFTIPTGITALKVTVIGGGGGGGGAANVQGCGGGGGGTAISFLTGLTSGNTLSVTIGGGGSGGASANGTGGTGGTTSLASGTQSISTISATGGSGGGGYAGVVGVGGVGSGGSFNNMYGGSPKSANSGFTTGQSLLSGDRSQNSPGAPGSSLAGSNYGGAGFGAYAGTSGCCWVPKAGGAGAAGCVLIEW